MRGRASTAMERRRSAKAWRGLVASFASSGLTLPQYCAREGIGIARYHRWQRLLALPPRRALSSMPATAMTMKAPEFVDLGALTNTTTRLELRLDLGGGVILQIARG